MIIEQVTQIGNPILSKKSKTVRDFNSHETKQIITDLVDSMRASNLIGMAAPQIWKGQRIFVTELRTTVFRKPTDTTELTIFINPKITWKSTKQSIMYESCGSVAYTKLFGPVRRPDSIIIEAYNEQGKKIKLKAWWLFARVIQHEYDHLDGICFTEKITDMKKVMSSEEYIKKFVQKK